MKRYSQLADLESLLLDIQDENIRAYAADAIASYSAGAYRSAIVSIWIAVVYDLYQKFRYLAETFGDKAAEECLKRIEKIRNNPDPKQVASWERTILDNACDNVKMLNRTDKDHLDRIQQDRHRCAHPVLDKEGFLFQPSPELVRTHIRTAIEVLLSQPPIIYKALSYALERDVESKYFPDNLEGVRNFLIGRHLPASEKYRSNLFIFCLKKVLYDEPFNEKFISRYMLVFECLLEEHWDTFEAIDREKLTKIIDQTREDRYCFLAHLLYIEKISGIEMSVFKRESFKNFALNDLHELNTLTYIINVIPEIAGNVLTKYLETYNYSEIPKKCQIINNLKELSPDVIDPDFIQKIIRINIDTFSQSETFDIAKSNARLISPIIHFLKDEDIKYLIKKLIDEQNKHSWDQLYECTYVMEEVFKSTIDKFPQHLDIWEDFIQDKTYRGWINIDKFKQLIHDKKYENF